MTKLLFHSFFPLIAGGVIYLFIRPSYFVLHAIANKLQIIEPVYIIREAAIPFYTNLPNIIVYNLPDGLWIYSFTSAILFVWNYQLNRWSIPFCLLPLFIGIGSEIGQFINLIPGTFDILDIIFYLFGFLLSITILTNQEQSGKIEI